MKHPLFHPAAALLLALALTLTGCITAHNDISAQKLASMPPVDVILLGEEHEAPEHHRLERESVEWLASRRVLAAVALEMVEQGHDTRSLSAQASEADVRKALAWDDTWPWPSYGPTVMAAVRAGIPVVGANWPRARLRETMNDSSLDALLHADDLARQQQRIDKAHCHLLPATHLPAMTRMQIARDRAMAQTLATAAKADRTVLLITGGGHVHRALGVPRHLPAALSSRVILMRSAGPSGDSASALDDDTLLAGDRLWPTSALPERDHCQTLRHRFRENGQTTATP